ncbi:hypothetical protein MPTK1_8g10030 [Marchantia polymorpha subsp. ruderalis]|uniref:Uncharacterized protein n=1 Tax=Marchantia polymorpha TaxID=3197 RepID=A0A2R6XMZ4_MARPO|nr:hypothetical protein MARPO_0008s0219 [Marchantia polymorpha]BBN19360.1 hypothetical protein Mp_8g10030 [Marchantia polymorpha subsp. ruderalis]|eukprot:PTQ47473.1 hypothetical protein MARPO_0008s0219 [Marchantia polymorpha]
MASAAATASFLGLRAPPRVPQCVSCPSWRASASIPRHARPVCQLSAAVGRPPVFQSVRIAGTLGERTQKLQRFRARSDEFELEDEVDFEMDRPELGEDEEDDMRDYEAEYESIAGYTTLQRGESDTFMSTEGEEEETVVDWKINEDEFHKMSLFNCDFFIRKISDPDDDVYDFREMYVTPPDTDTYSIPKVVGTMPKKPVRCTASRYEYIHTTEPPVDQPRAPLYKTDMECMKIFLMRHLKDRRTDHEKFILDFEEIYVIDSKSKSITRAEVKVEVPGGKNRDRSQEVLIVRDDGNTFKIIPEEEQMTPDEVIGAMQWEKTRENMENYLRGFRDYETSNWF